jgi:TolB-like protein
MEDFMKKHMFVMSVLAIMVICFLDSCVSTQTRMLGPDERSNIEMLGSVTANFISFQGLHWVNEDAIQRQAYAKLMDVAKKQYAGKNIDVVNVTASGSFNPLTLLTSYVTMFLTNVQTVTATGDVVSYNSGTGTNRANQEKLRIAIEMVCKDLINKLPRGSTIAVLSIGSQDRSASEYTVDEIEYILVNNGRFIIVNRGQLDRVREEQNFQMSGDVSDNSAVSIGNILGASIVITGTITTNGSAGRITIRALDVKTAQIVTMTRGEY